MELSLEKIRNFVKEELGKPHCSWLVSQISSNFPYSPNPQIPRLSDFPPTDFGGGGRGCAPAPSLNTLLTLSAPRHY